MSDCQNYHYEANKAGMVRWFTLRKNGKYVAKGESLNGTVLLIGHRDSYHDYSF